VTLSASGAATVGGRDRLRLFCGFPLPADTTALLAAWQAGLGGGGRIVEPEHLHVTLAFLGSRPAGDLQTVVEALRDAAGGAPRPRFAVCGYRETRSVGMLTLDDEDGRGAAIAGRLHALLEQAGLYRPEGRDWLPHVTVLRFRERPRLRPSLPAAANICPSDASVYLSRLSPSGARYEVLESVALE
jgi:RNA 2',3'-cyclic 3'-phosphodiesterase